MERRSAHWEQTDGAGGEHGGEQRVERRGEGEGELRGSPADANHAASPVSHSETGAPAATARGD